MEDGIELISGQHVLSSDYSDQPQGIPYLTGPADFPDGKIHVTKFTHKPKVKCQAGDILITVKGSGTGKVVRADRVYGISRQLMAVRVKGWDADFVYHFLEKSRGRYENTAAGLIPGISRKDVLLTPILVPPLTEQRKMAELLDVWDKAIVAGKQLIAAKQQYRQALMQRLLTGYWQFDEFVGQPWREVQLDELLTMKLRKVPKPSASYQALGIRSHGKGTFIRTVHDPDEVAMVHLYEVKAGDLVVNITFAWEGAIALVQEYDEGCLVSHRFPTYVFNRERVDPEFFKYLMVTSRFIHELGVISPGGAGRNRVLSKKNFLKIKILLPSLKEQARIAQALCTTDREIELLNQKLDALQRQKKGLMQQLFTGQIRL